MVVVQELARLSGSPGRDLRSLPSSMSSTSPRSDFFEILCACPSTVATRLTGSGTPGRKPSAFSFKPQPCGGLFCRKGCGCAHVRGFPFKPPKGGYSGLLAKRAICQWRFAQGLWENSGEMLMPANPHVCAMCKGYAHTHSNDNQKSAGAHVRFWPSGGAVTSSSFWN